MKLTIRINLLFSIIVSCILLGMTLIFYFVTRENVEHDFRQRMKTRAARSAYLYNLFQKDTTRLLDSMDANTPTLLNSKNVMIYDSSFKLLYAYHDPNVSPLAPGIPYLKKAKYFKEAYYQQDHREIGIYYFTENKVPLVVTMSAEDTTGRAYINSLKKVFLLYVPIAILVTLMAGYIFSRSIIQPVKETIRDVKLITSQNLSHRLYTGQRKDELAELNNTFNDLLNRLEESFAIEKRFIANASHELSTPLTAISSQIEVALLQDRDVDTYKKVLASIQEDAQGLHELTRTLLEIARAGNNGAITLEKIRLDEVLIKANTDLLRQHNGYKTTLQMAELPDEENAGLVFGNSHLLCSAFKNIMENGCKYSPDRAIHVTLTFREELIEISFLNKSDYIPPAETERLFEPFYRGGNAFNEPGAGLGLTLTRRIIGLHKGTLTLSSLPGIGTRIFIQLPAVRH